MAFKAIDGVVHEHGMLNGNGAGLNGKIERMFDNFGSLKGLQSLLRYVLIRTFGIRPGLFRRFEDIGVNSVTFFDPTFGSEKEYLSVNWKVTNHWDEEGENVGHPSIIEGSLIDSTQLGRVFNFRFEEAYNYDTGDRAYDIHVEEVEIAYDTHRPEYYLD